ncbi:transposase%2C Mutator family protein [Mycobacteroides abscessus]|uniref:hypothetical protein n=1 Tax=Cellulosimicrobium funkei TaxID=264251 RepID=UPI0005E7D892|nr:transposase%2C Mutator family protein [Mycobacteroides abscessus]
MHSAIVKLWSDAWAEFVHLAVMALDPASKGSARWTYRWKEALNAFEVTFDGWLCAGRR